MFHSSALIITPADAVTTSNVTEVVRSRETSVFAASSRSLTTSATARACRSCDQDPQFIGGIPSNPPAMWSRIVKHGLAAQRHLRVCELAKK